MPPYMQTKYHNVSAVAPSPWWTPQSTCGSVDSERDKPCSAKRSGQHKTPCRHPREIGARRRKTIGSMSERDCGSRGERNVIQRTVKGPSHCVLASIRWTAAVMDARTAKAGYPDRVARCIHAAQDNRNEPQECMKGRVFESAERKTLVRWYAGRW